MVLVEYFYLRIKLESIFGNYSVIVETSLKNIITLHLYEKINKICYIFN